MSYHGVYAQGKQPEAVDIPDSGFFPGINTENFRKTMRISENILNEQVVFQIKAALLYVISQLRTWERVQIKKGYQKLSEVPTVDTDGNEYISVIAGENEKEMLFYQAVFNHGKALVMETYRDIDTTRKAGVDRAEAGDLSIPDYKRESISAIRQIRGEPRTSARIV